MVTNENYKSFNKNKDIEELQSNLKQYKLKLEDLIIDFQFFETILNAPIYKTKVLNLFENLQRFKEDINGYKNEVSKLLEDISRQVKIITKKIECGDLICDNFFVQNHDSLDRSILNLLKNSHQFKAEMFQYLASVIKDLE